MDQLSNLNVASQEVLPTPAQIGRELPVTEIAAETVTNGRKAVCDILDGNDNRLFVVVGPCSIHDVDAAMEYARRLKTLADQVSEQMLLIMRVYFEKPRTTTGWKGLINDPRLDDSFHIEEGIRLARQLLLDIAELGLPVGTEALDPIMPQYLQELVTWTAIGARTTESQTHREMASGLSTPVGFKNGTDGNVEVAVNAMKSVSSPHNFLGINADGLSAVIRTRGNRYGHVVLRGGHDGPNYQQEAVTACQKQLEKASLASNVVVDCSHANSGKNPEQQPAVMSDCVNQVAAGGSPIVGLMIESNLEAGNQSIPENLNDLKYGVSVTDGCVDWSTTERMIVDAAQQLSSPR